jgi:hypothetical protein
MAPVRVAEIDEAAQRPRLLEDEHVLRSGIGVKNDRGGRARQTIDERHHALAQWRNRLPSLRLLEGVEESSERVPDAARKVLRSLVARYESGGEERRLVGLVNPTKSVPEREEHLATLRDSEVDLSERATGHRREAEILHGAHPPVSEGSRYRHSGYSVEGTKNGLLLLETRPGPSPRWSLRLHHDAALQVVGASLTPRLVDRQYAPRLLDVPASDSFDDLVGENGVGGVGLGVGIDERHDSSLLDGVTRRP